MRMTTAIAAFAPETIPVVEYGMVDHEQAAHISEAMILPENQEKFEVSFLPVDTPEARRAVAEEWSAYKQALADIATREYGAVAYFSSRDDSPEAIEQHMEQHLEADSQGWLGAHAVSKVVIKVDGAKSIDLLKTYYKF